MGELIRRANVAAGVDVRVDGLQAVVDLHTLSLHYRADNFRSVAVFARENAVRRLNQKNFRAKAREALRRSSRNQSGQRR